MRLKQHHYRAIQMMLQGASRAEIGEELNVEPSSVGWWQRTPEFKEEMERQREALRATITQTVTGRLLTEAPASVGRMVHLRDHARSEAVQLSAAEGILDKAGFKAIERVHQVTAIAVTPELLAAVHALVGEMASIPQGFTGVKALPERGST